MSESEYMDLRATFYEASGKTTETKKRIYEPGEYARRVKLAEEKREAKRKARSLLVRRRWIRRRRAKEKAEKKLQLS